MLFHKKTAIWALTPQAMKPALLLAEKISGADLLVSEKAGPAAIPCIRFGRLADAVAEAFSRYDAHIFIMSAGIAVRMIAPHIRHKTADPAVVVMDELGLHAISLISGHIGGANRLAQDVAAITGARPVITTATDINHVPAIDVIAVEKNLFIENPAAIKSVSMALLTGQKIRVHDPFHLLDDAIPSHMRLYSEDLPENAPGVFVDDRVADAGPETLVLRPRTLAVGMGCNRGTDADEMHELLRDTFEKSGLSVRSIRQIASVDLKKDEVGLIALAGRLNLPLRFFDRETLDSVTTIENPSAMVKKHIGIRSVCEAAAILAAGNGKLVVPKRNTRNVTIAVARLLPDNMPKEEVFE